MKASVHWGLQRITAAILLFMLPWFGFHIVDKNISECAVYFAQPLQSLGLLLLLLTVIYHMVLGIEVIIDDYVHTERLNSFMMWSLKIKALLLAAFGTFCILNLIG